MSYFHAAVRCIVVFSYQSSKSVLFVVRAGKQPAGIAHSLESLAVCEAVLDSSLSVPEELLLHAVCLQKVCI